MTEFYLWHWFKFLMRVLFRYNLSLPKALSAIYPEYPWKDHFTRQRKKHKKSRAVKVKPPLFWRDKQNALTFMRQLENALGIRAPMDWYIQNTWHSTHVFPLGTTYLKFSFLNTTEEVCWRIFRPFWPSAFVGPTRLFFWSRSLPDELFFFRVHPTFAWDWTRFRARTKKAKQKCAWKQNVFFFTCLLLYRFGLILAQVARLKNFLVIRVCVVNDYSVASFVLIKCTQEHK